MAFSKLDGKGIDLSSNVLTSFASTGIDDNASSTALTVTDSGVAATLTTASQPNITSVGTLTGFTSTGIDDNAGSTAITIDYFGRVGVGTSSPDSLVKMDVICPSDYGPAIQCTSNSSASNWARFDVKNQNVTGSLIIYQDSGGNSSIRNNCAGGSLGFIAGSGGNPAPITFQNEQGTETARLDSNGRFGIGVSSPSELLHVNGTIVTETAGYSSNQDQPYLIAGSKNYTGATTNWGTWGIQHRLKTNSAGVPRVTIDVNQGNKEAFSVFNNGDIAFGGGDNFQATHGGSDIVVAFGEYTTTSKAVLQLNGSTINKYASIFCSNGNLHIDSGSGDGIYLNWYTSDSFSTGSTSGTFFGNGSGGNVGQISGAGTVYHPTTYTQTVTGRDVYIASNGQLGYLSSIREHKTNIESLTDVSWLYNLNPVKFNYKLMSLNEITEELEINEDEHETEFSYGLIADEVESLNPDFVFYSDSGTLEGVEYKKFTAVLIKALQNQKDTIDSLEARIIALEAN